jgi:membrane fusion protein (multidrug efflux system)
MLLSVSVGAVACSREAEDTSAPPPEVLVAPVVRRDVPVLVEAVGETRGSETVEIRARVEGFIERIAFKEGDRVAAGDLLYVIDPKPFQADVSRARATVAQAEAVFRRAKLEERRLAPLADTGAISRSEYDDALTNLQTSRANLDAAKAALDSAQLDLGYARIISPIEGIAGFSEVQEGDLVGRGENTLLTTVSDVDPIWVRFAVSEREYLKFYRRSLERAKSSAEAVEGADAEVSRPGVATRGDAAIRMRLADGSEHPYEGVFRVADRAVDPSTGTLSVEVTFPNPDQLVRPGQFARVELQTEVERDAVLVPQRAMRELQGSYSVAIVGDDETIELRPVTTARRFESFYVVSSGLEGNEKVVVEGLQRARSGTKVRPIMVELTEDGRLATEDGPKGPGSEAPGSDTEPKAADAEASRGDD